MHKYKRFWHQIDDPIRLTEDGFLFDPEANSKINRNPNAKAFDTINNIKCLVMLGDQGMGKTYAINEAYEKIKVCGANCMFLDTRTGDASYLDKKVSMNEKFQEWSNGRDELFIFLDSLDEGSLSVKEKLDVITDSLRNHKSESNRLYLRIACRTASWLSGLEKMFCNFWNQQDVGVYELAPLRWIDVQAASAFMGLDIVHFQNSIEEKGITHLASKPITLHWLLEEYKKIGDLPSSQVGLLELGCLELCHEVSVDTGRYRRLNNTQRMAIAGYIATISVLTNKHVIWYGKDRSCFNRNEELCIDELVGKQVDADGSVIELDTDHIKEVLNTALFSGGTSDHRNWSHSSYMDFLAAWYCKDKLELRQVKSLIQQCGELVPQLYGFISFLASMSSVIFDDLLDTDFEVLLYADMANLSDHQKARLMFNELEGREKSGLVSQKRRPYHNLVHHGMDECIRKYMCDKSKDVASRYEAITIVESCELKYLQSELVAIALDISEPISLRIHSAYAIINIDDPDIKSMLKPLAYGNIGDDPDDVLRQCGLKVVWPDLISAKEMFLLITHLEKRSSYRACRGFLLNDVLPHMKQLDVIYALEWICTLASHDMYDTFDKAIENIFEIAMGGIDDPETLEIFCRAVLSCIANHMNIPMPVGFEIYRQRILTSIISQAADFEIDSFQLRSSSLCFTGDDLQLLLSLLKSPAFEKQYEIIAMLITLIVDLFQPDQFDIIYNACKEHEILAKHFARTFNPIIIDSDEAKNMKVEFDKRKAYQNQEKKLLDPPPSEWVIRSINEFNRNNLQAWVVITNNLTLKSDSVEYEDIINPDITTLPGWGEATEDTRAEIIAIAKEYILFYTPHYDDWLSSELSVNIHDDFAGYKALHLLLKKEPAFIASITVDIWEKWAPIIFASNEIVYICNEYGNRLYQLAYNSVTDWYTYTILALIDRDNKIYNHVSCFGNTKDYWNDDIDKAVFNKLDDESLTAMSIGELLQLLIFRGNSRAKKYAENLVSHYKSIDAGVRAKAVYAAQALLSEADDAGWSIIWDAITSSTDFGCDVFRKFESDWLHTNDDQLKLSVDQLVDLYIWSKKHFLSEDENRNNRIPALLQIIGASTALERIAKEFPEYPRFKYMVEEARHIEIKASWKPSTINDINHLLSNRDTYLVKTSEQLADAVIESLKRLNDKLHDEGSPVQFLWNEMGDNKYRPKKETAFSDFVKMHLDSDLKQRPVIFNREVGIRPAIGSDEGEISDIVITAINKEKQKTDIDKLQVIIEVKCCWNKDLTTAMQNQLVGRYLNKNSCKHGIYLVGWFDSSQWDDVDSRKGISRKKNRSKVENQLGIQAKELSQSGLSISYLGINASLEKEVPSY